MFHMYLISMAMRVYLGVSRLEMDCSPSCTYIHLSETLYMHAYAELNLPPGPTKRLAERGACMHAHVTQCVALNKLSSAGFVFSGVRSDKTSLVSRGTSTSRVLLLDS